MYLTNPQLILALSSLALASSSSSSSSSSPSTPSSSTTPSTDPPPFSYPPPFTHPSLPSYTPTCTSKHSFPAYLHTLNDLFDPLPTGLLPYASRLRKHFTGKHYPYAWDGADPHLAERPLLRMRWADVPARVREWIDAVRGSAVEGESELAGFAKGSLFAVMEPEEGKDDAGEREVVFAPGAMYPLLPLWVAGGSGCDDVLADLSLYGAEPRDGGIIAGVTERKRLSQQTKEYEFTITAQVLKAKSSDERDEL